jgi:IS5 family transposase
VFDHFHIIKLANEKIDELRRSLAREVEVMLVERKWLLREGTIVDTTNSTRNARRERDPEMRSTLKGQPWYFGMKAHIGVDAASDLVYRVSATAANTADVVQAHECLHRQEKVSDGDAAYQGVEERPKILAKHARVR